WRAWAEAEVPGEDGVKRMPGGQSRWSQGKDLSWEPLRPELVVEVAYDHMQGDRFRHTAQFRRWRADKKPADCTYAQLEVVPPQELAAIFPSGRCSDVALTTRPHENAPFRGTAARRVPAEQSSAMPSESCPCADAMGFGYCFFSLLFLLHSRHSRVGSSSGSGVSCGGRSSSGTCCRLM